MPKLFIPHKSDAHRVACTSLYRALLKQCDELVSTTAAAGRLLPSSTFQNLIRYRFRRDCKLRSPNNIRNALIRGHSHHSLLREVTSGSRSALKQLLETLCLTFEDAEKTAGQREIWRANRPPLETNPKALHKQRVSTKGNHRPPADAVGLSAHPLPLSALKSESRIVPSLVVGQKNIPFLRYGKQPVHLSRVLRQKMQWMERAHSRLHSLERLRDLGFVEDDWDRIVSDQIRAELPAGVNDHSPSRNREPSWADAPGQIRTQIYALIREKEAKSGEIGTRMWEIVKQEQRLKNWEDLPFSVAKAIRKIRQIEVQLYNFAERYKTRYRFPLRPHNEPITDQVELKQLGRFDIPVEYVTCKGDTSPQYSGKRQSRDNFDRPEPGAQDGTTGVTFKPFGQR